MARVSSVSREKWKIFWEKAGEFLRTMRQAHEKGDYNASVANAVHCGISASDAFSVIRLGRKSSGQNHAEAILLLKEARTSDESEKSRVCEKLYQLLEMKNPAEYEDRRMSKAEADRAASLCEKVYSFISSEIKRAEAFQQ